MSQSEVLYMKGMNMSESEEDTTESAWDDKKLTDAYDKALKIANAEVAKRVAMSTNSRNVSKEGRDHESSKNKKDKVTSKRNSSKKKEIQWKVGMPCRSVYEGDGLEYEAFVLRIINDEECIVRYLGYENSEVVPINTLKPTTGNEARTLQIEQALLERADDGFGSQSPNAADAGTSDRVPSPDSIDRAMFAKKKRTSKKKKSNNNMHQFELPQMPMMPNISMLRNAGTMEMPMPPPPMAFTSESGVSEDQAISSMLLSWYMSGYYTGLYQGLKRSKETRRNV